MDRIADIPFRTLTCTFEYPFVTFFTLRTTFDMLIDRRTQTAVAEVEEEDKRKNRKNRRTKTNAQEASDDFTEIRR